MFGGFSVGLDKERNGLNHRDLLNDTTKWNFKSIWHVFFLINNKYSSILRAKTNPIKKY